MNKIYAVKCIEKVEYHGLGWPCGSAAYFDDEQKAEELATWIKENSLSCDFDVCIEEITLGKLDKDFISYVIS